MDNYRDSSAHILQDFLDYERQHQFVAEYLTKVDGATMFYALEARSPFLDQELWEFASSLPFPIRLHGGKSKAVLRELASRVISPRVAFGRKRGFGIPAERWMLTRWRSLVDSAFDHSVLVENGWIKAAGLAAAWTRALGNKHGAKASLVRVCP